MQDDKLSAKINDIVKENIEKEEKIVPKNQKKRMSVEVSQNSDEKLD